jgi:hypothetical protein
MPAAYKSIKTKEMKFYPLTCEIPSKTLSRPEVGFLFWFGFVFSAEEGLMKATRSF